MQTASDITDERMLLTVSPQQTTLYDQIRYSGSPGSFAWVLPIHGTVDVGLSADVLFDSLDELTATQIDAPASDCPTLPQACFSSGDDDGADSAFLGSASNGVASPVTVTKAANVGPYETVQLHAADSGALNDWLAANGFEIPADVTPVIDGYVTEGFDFLALKLLPQEGIQAMRPVRVTSQGASLSLPLRMAAVGTGVSVGITLWVVSDGRYEPANFPFFHIADTDLVWDWTAGASNYTTLRASNEAALGGKGWEIESSLDLSVETITATILDGGQVSYGAGYTSYGGSGSYGGPPSSTAGSSDASEDYLPVEAADGGAGESADQARDDDVSTLFAGLDQTTVRVTRIRSDIAHTAMTQDFILAASADQSELSNVRTVTRQINEQCTLYDENCQASGTGTKAQADADVAQTERSQQGCRAAPSKRPESPTGLLTLGALGAFMLLGMRRRR